MTVTQLAGFQTVACQRRRPATATAPSTTTTSTTSTSSSCSCSCSFSGGCCSCSCSNSWPNQRGDDSGGGSSSWSSTRCPGPSPNRLVGAEFEPTPPQAADCWQQRQQQQHHDIDTKIGGPHGRRSRQRTGSRVGETEADESVEHQDREAPERQAGEAASEQQARKPRSTRPSGGGCGCQRALGEQMLAGAGLHRTPASRRRLQLQQQHPHVTARRTTTSRVHLQLILAGLLGAAIAVAPLITELSVAASAPELEAAAVPGQQAAPGELQLQLQQRHQLELERRLSGLSQALLRHQHPSSDHEGQRRLRRQEQQQQQLANPAVGPHNYNQQQQQQQQQQPDGSPPLAPEVWGPPNSPQQQQQTAGHPATGAGLIGRPANEPAASRQFVSYSRQATVAPLLHHQHQHQQHHNYHHHQQQRQPNPAYPLAPTTPTLNRQLVAPATYQSLADSQPAGYELALRPTGVLQLEPLGGVQSSSSALTVDDESGGGGGGGGEPFEAHHHHHHHHQQQQQQHRGARFVGLGSGPHLRLAHWLQPPGRQQQPQQLSHSESGQQPVFASNSSQHEAREAGWQQQQQQADQPTRLDGPSGGGGGGASQESAADQSAAAAKAQGPQDNGGDNSGPADGSPAGPTGSRPLDGQAADEKTSIEPRGARRRLFNRILKKAEWNHLFVELSKVFLRYFLDLALKDIIGKQSGGLGSAGGGGGGGGLADSSGSTSQKKLDAQSQLADLLREFVKTAISNMR